MIKTLRGIFLSLFILSFAALNCAMGATDEIIVPPFPAYLPLTISFAGLPSQGGTIRISSGTIILRNLPFGPNEPVKIWDANDEQEQRVNPGQYRFAIIP